MRTGVTLMMALCATAGAAFAQENTEQNRVPFNVQRESGIYTTKSPTPVMAPNGQKPPTKFIFKGDAPFGRISPDATIPVPTGPRTVTSAPVPGVDSMEASEPTLNDILTNDLPEAVANPTKATAQTGSIFEDKDVAPRPMQLRALNKVTGHATLITLQPGQEEVFGNLTIHAHVCRSAMENTQPDSAALVDIIERRPDETVDTPLFSGWMFASSPSLTGLEHPVYDISVVTCKNAKTGEEKAPTS